MPEPLTEGPIGSQLLKLAIPIVLTNLLQTAYQLIDTFWVGRLGAEAVAAVSLSFPVISLLVSLGGGLSIAGAILIAQYKGAQLQARVDHVATQTMLLLGAVSVLLSALGYFLSPFIIGLMGAEAEVARQASSYLRVTFLGLAFVFVYYVFQGIMRGVGEVRVPVYIVAGTVLMNLVLDPLFIFGYGPIPAWGVSGAALATIITQGLGMLVGVFILSSGRYGVHVRRSELKPDWKLFRRMLRLGFPASIEQSARAGGLLILTFLVASFGTVAVAAYGIGTRILSFVIIPALGLSMATSTLVGQNLGADKPERAQRSATLAAIAGFVGLSIVGALFFIFASQLATVFLPGSPEASGEAALFIRIMSLTFGLISVQIVMNGVFQGAGRTLASMLLAIISLWVLRFPLAYVLSKHTALAVQGIWWAFPAGNLIAAGIAITWYLQGEWKKGKLTGDAKLEERVHTETLAEEGVE